MNFGIKSTNYLISHSLGWSVVVWRVFCINNVCVPGQCAYNRYVWHITECVQWVCVCVYVYTFCDVYGGPSKNWMDILLSTSLLNSVCVCVCRGVVRMLSTRVPWSLRFLGHVHFFNGLLTQLDLSKSTWRNELLTWSGISHDILAERK